MLQRTGVIYIYMSMRSCAESLLSLAVHLRFRQVCRVENKKQPTWQVNDRRTHRNVYASSENSILCLVDTTCRERLYLASPLMDVFLALVDRLLFDL